MSALQASHVEIAFGGVKALQGVSFTAEHGKVLSIIGPNGAGKTTLFNVVSGVYRASHGTIMIEGEDVSGLPPFRLARRGLSRTFQNLQIFEQMSVVANVMVGRHLHERRSILLDMLGLPSVGRQNAESRRHALEALEFVGLAREADQPASDLSYGALKRLELARALAAEPSILLLDEPAAGCNPRETAELGQLIRSIADRGVALVLVEHDMKLVMGISDEILVMASGRPLAFGCPSDVRNDPKVIAAYLGTGASEVADATS